MSDQRELLDTLRAALHRDLDEDTISLVPPSVVIGLVAGEDEGAMITVYCITYGYLLRHLMRGMAPEEAVKLAESYLGMQPAGAWQQLSDMRRVCKYANDILAKTIPREQAIKQMMTWKHADQRMIDGLLDETIAIYRQENRTTYSPPEPEWLAPDGEIFNHSFSTSAPHVDLNFNRLLRYDPEIGAIVRKFRRAAMVFSLILIGDIVLFATGHWIFALLLLPVLWFSSKFARFVFYVPKIKENMKRLFESALLTPGIIEKVDPLTIICLAQMRNSGDKDYLGLKRMKIIALPLHLLRRGEIIPCVSGFEEGDAEDHWADYSPRPICWGTDDELKIRDLKMKLDQSQVDKLKLLLEQGPLPTDTKILILDQHFAPLP